METIDVTEALLELDDAMEPCTAEAAECTCPDFCERDHEQD